MKRFKKIVAMCASAVVAASVLAVPVLAADPLIKYVSRTDKYTQRYSFSNVTLENFYDYGSPAINDDAYMSSRVYNSGSKYGYISFKAYGTGAWDHADSDSGYCMATIGGCDYFQGGSYSLAKDGTETDTKATKIELRVVD